MRILIVQSNTADHSPQAEAFLAQVYPEAERLYVSYSYDLFQTLDQDAIDLVLVDASLSWKHYSKLLQLIHDGHPGLPVILITPEHSATQVALEEELRHSQISLDTLLNTPSDIILVIDTQRRVTLANQTFYQRRGKLPEEIVGRTMFEIFPSALAEKHDAILRQVIETGEPVRFEAHAVDGWLDSTIVPVRDPQGRVIHVIVYAHDITELKKLEEGLAISQQTIDALMNAPVDVILLVDRQGKVFKVNQTFYQRTAKSPGEVLGRSIHELLPPALAQERNALVQQVFKSGEIVRFEDRGITGWYDHSVYPILDGQNQIAYVAVISRDITDQKRLEEILRRDQRAMQAMANVPNDIFVLLDLSGTILMTNEVMARSLGYEMDELIGLCLWDLLPKPVADFRRGVFNRVLQTGLPERVDDQGPIGLYDSRVIPILDDEGQTVQVVIMARDITERKRAELALKVSEERYRTLVETSPYGVAFQDLKGHLLLVNQQFAALFGYEGPEEIYNLQINGSDLIAEQDPVRRQEIMRNAWQNGSMRDATFTAHRKDGSLFQVEVNGSVVHDPEGKPTGIITICRDVTERNRIQEELARSRANLEQRVIERTAELQAMNRQLRKEIYLRKQAEEQWRRQALHARALAQVASRANTQLGLKAVLKAICMELIRVLPYPISCVSLYHEDIDSLTIDVYASQVEISTGLVPPIPRALYEDYLQKLGPVIVIPDIRGLPLGSSLAEAASPAIRTVVCIPLYDDGKLIGVLLVASVDEIFMPSEDELDLLQAISDQTALSIKNTRLFERVSEGQANLRMLTERLVEVQEDERRNLARELHDEIGQMLTSLSLNLEIINRSIEAGEARSSIQKDMESIRGQVKLLLDQVRDLSLNLLPAMLEDLGLLPTLLDHCQRFTAQTGIRVELAHHGLEVRLPTQLETAAYRIVQEALTNVARHSGVNQVDVRLWATPYLLGVQVEDLGVGFDLQQVESAHQSSGLSGMRERAANCGGTLEIETMLGQGTCLTAEFPLDKHNPIR